MIWTVHHRAETESTQRDARVGKSGDVFTADFQTAGRGRLDHKWLSPPGTNLMMSVVLSVEGLSPGHVVTLPLVVGLAVAKALRQFIIHHSSFIISLKWPNDVLVDGKKIAGILCERQDDNVIVGIGVNVGQTEFDKEIADRATSLAVIFNTETRIPRANASCEAGASGVRHRVGVAEVRAAVLDELGRGYDVWREKGFAAVYPEIVELDCLKGREVSVRQTDGDMSPISGVSNGIMADGSLDVGGVKVYAGEAHVEKM